ncbi:MAG: hypothetical protein Q8R39_02850 [bacterium]|nr:hypothetical protein [bacterium]MDZ4284672.1 hypothetical protein [Patescibacteria group bacterium]
MDGESKKRPRVVKRVTLSLLGLGLVLALGWWLYACVFVGRVAAVLVSPTGTLFLGRITWFPHPVLHDPWVLVIDQQAQATDTLADDTAQAQAEPRILPWTSAVPFVPKGKRLSVPRSSIIQWSYLDKTDNFRQFLASGGQQVQQNPLGGLPQQQVPPRDLPGQQPPRLP